MFITSTAMGPLIDEVARLVPDLTLFAVGGTYGAYADFEQARADEPTHADRRRKRRLGHALLVRHHGSAPRA